MCSLRSHGSLPSNQTLVSNTFCGPFRKWGAGQTWQESWDDARTTLGRNHPVLFAYYSDPRSCVHSTVIVRKTSRICAPRFLSGNPRLDCGARPRACACTYCPGGQNITIVITFKCPDGGPVERISIGNHSRISLPVHLHFQNVHVGDIFDEEGNTMILILV